MARTWGLFGGALDTPTKEATAENAAYGVDPPGRKDDLEHGQRIYYQGEEEWTDSRQSLTVDLSQQMVCREDPTSQADPSPSLPTPPRLSEVEAGEGEERSHSPELVMLWTKGDSEIDVLTARASDPDNAHSGEGQSFRCEARSCRL